MAPQDEIKQMPPPPWTSLTDLEISVDRTLAPAEIRMLPGLCRSPAAPHRVSSHREAQRPSADHVVRLEMPAGHRSWTLWAQGSEGTSWPTGAFLCLLRLYPGVCLASITLTVLAQGTCKFCLSVLSGWALGPQNLSL